MSNDAVGGLMVIWMLWLTASMYLIPGMFVIGLFSSKISIWSGLKWSFNLAILSVIGSALIVFS